MLQYPAAMFESDLTRRQFISRAAKTAGLVGITATSAYAGLIELYNYELTHTDVLIKNLPAAFSGFRITQISDVHHSPLVGIEEVQRVVEIAGGTNADLIVLTGDYTTERRRYIEPCAERLARLRAPAGVWAILGNHDHSTDPELTTRALKRVGIGVLRNANTTIRRGADYLQLVGIDDWSWNQTDWAHALRGTTPTQPLILLSHQPLVFDLPETQGFSLILSGHTHGGQVSLPLVGAPLRFMREFRYVRGLYERAGTQLYVSRGTGVIGLPVRLGARPEISVLRLLPHPEDTPRSSVSQIVC